MIAIVGLGGAGGNLADEAVQYGFKTGAINFSQKDLDSLDNVEFKLKLIGSEGVGHNRDEAISLLSDRYDIAVDFIKENFGHGSIEIIIFTFSTGGGSGSGIAPILIDILSNVMPDKIFVAMPILPDHTEVAISQINCSKTFEELSKLDVAIFPVDNNKTKITNPHVGKNKIYEITNSTAMSLVHKIVSYTEKFSKNGNFDKKDLKTVFNTKGIGLISETDINYLIDGAIDLSPQGVSGLVHKSWDKSVFAPIEFEKVIRAGIIFDAQEQFMQFLDYESIFSKFRKGMPIDLFEGNYHENSGKILTILSGLSWCSGRLAEVDLSIEQNKAKIQDVITSTHEYQSNAVDIENLIRKQPQKPKSSVMDILSKYRR